MALHTNQEVLQSVSLVSENKTNQDDFLMEEFKAIKPEGDFFLKMLGQSRNFANQFRQRKIDQNIHELEKLLSVDYPKVQDELAGEQANAHSLSGEIKSLKRKFNRLKKRAMENIKEFITIKII